MAFGQASGPPASAKQLAALEVLLAEAGYVSFREARHPLGLTQRQANGKFTRDEADELLERLEAAAQVGSEPGHQQPRPEEQVRDDRPSEQHPASPRSRHPRAPRRSPQPAAAGAADEVVTAFPDELLAAELVRRGWTCEPPP